MRIWNTITPVLSLSFLHFIHPSLSLALSPPLMASGEVCDGSSCWNIYWSVFLSFIYFPLFPLALPSPLHRPRNTSSTMRCQRRRRGWKSTTWNHYLAFVAPSSFTCVNKTRGASVGSRQQQQHQVQQEQMRHRLSCETGGLFGIFWSRHPLQGVVDRKHQGAALFCPCKGSCTQLQAIEVVVVMATMPWAIIITIVLVLA